MQNFQMLRAAGTSVEGEYWFCVTFCDFTDFTHTHFDRNFPSPST